MDWRKVGWLGYSSLVVGCCWFCVVVVVVVVVVDGGDGGGGGGIFWWRSLMNEIGFVGCQYPNHEQDPSFQHDHQTIPPCLLSLL